MKIIEITVSNIVVPVLLLFQLILRHLLRKRYRVPDCIFNVFNLRIELAFALQ